MPKDPASFPFYLVANKSDLSAERKVTVERVNDYCHKHPDLIFHETSALTGSNVEVVFKSVATKHLALAGAGSTSGTASELSSLNDNEDGERSTDQGPAKRKFDLEEQKRRKKGPGKRCPTCGT